LLGRQSRFDWGAGPPRAADDGPPKAGRYCTCQARASILECMGALHGGPAARHVGPLPQTPLGRRAVGLVGIGAVFFVATILLANVGGQAGTGWVALPLIPAGLAAGAGAIAAVVATIRDHERGGIVFIPLIVGLAIAFLVIGEFITPM